MIGHIKGYIDYIGENMVVIDNNGIGYNIFVPSSVISAIASTGDEIKLYTYMSVREDAMQLYGFLTRDELVIFKLLLGVNGIGPKAGISILSNLTPNNLRYAVISDDIKAINAVPGIGVKTAQKLILELKDKLNLEDVFNDEYDNFNDNKTLSSDILNDSIMALASLGYSRTEAMKAVKSIHITEDMDTQDILKEALKKLY